MCGVRSGAGAPLSSGPRPELNRRQLESICNNLLITTINSENEEMNTVKDQNTGVYGGMPDMTRQYKEAGIIWVIFNDENCGEGNSREHAALEPRFL